MNTPLGRNRLLGIANLVATIATPSRVWLEGTKLLVTAGYTKTQSGAQVPLVPQATEPQIFSCCPHLLLFLPVSILYRYWPALHAYHNCSESQGPHCYHHTAASVVLGPSQLLALQMEREKPGLGLDREEKFHQMLICSSFKKKKKKTLKYY